MTGVEAQPTPVSGARVFRLPDSLWKALQQFAAFTAAQKGCEQESGNPDTLLPQDAGTDVTYSIAAASGFVPGFSAPLSLAFSTW